MDGGLPKSSNHFKRAVSLSCSIAGGCCGGCAADSIVVFFGCWLLSWVALS